MISVESTININNSTLMKITLINIVDYKNIN